MWTALLVALTIAVIFWLLRGAPELAKLEVRGAEVRFVSGRMPGRLLDDFEDVLVKARPDHAEVRIVVEGGRPRVIARGLDEGRVQQLRNVLGPYQVAQIRAGRRAAGRS